MLQEFSDACKKRSAIEREADTFLSDHPDYQRLKTIPGIGSVIALAILAEAGDLRRFRYAKQFL